ncbi:MAG: hypothetical protein H6862_00170 [Rhodospirillales bacterium]|nr:hypothetical protein [Rhodospirillales bacterium]
MISGSRVPVAALCLVAAFAGAAQAMDEEIEDLPPSAQAVLDEESQKQDTCFAFSETYRMEIERSWPRTPERNSSPCVSGSGRKVVMTCGPSGAWKERLEGHRPVVEVTEESGETAEYFCKTAPITGF